MSLGNRKRLIHYLAALGVFLSYGLSAPALARAGECQKNSAVLKPVPRMKYKCPASSDQSDDKILELPQRKAALASVTKALESLTDDTWWKSEIDKAGACSSDSSNLILGGASVRLIIIADPCYQTEFNGSNLFLLARSGSKSVATEIVDGNFSRLENSVSFETAKNGTEDLVIISTAGELGMYPNMTAAAFAIDPATKKAGKRSLFLDEGKPSNERYTEVPLSDSEDAVQPLEIVQAGRLAPSFVTYEDGGAPDGAGEDATDRNLKTVTYKWDGAKYLPSTE